MGTPCKYIATYTYNSKVNTTGYTPFKVFIVQKPRFPIDLVIPTPDPRTKNEDEYVGDTIQ